MGVQENPYPLRIDKTLMAKLKVLAQANSRSVNKEIEFAVKEQIRRYEQEAGPISVGPES